MRRDEAFELAGMVAGVLAAGLHWPSSECLSSITELLATGSKGRLIKIGHTSHSSVLVCMPECGPLTKATGAVARSGERLEA